jgi:outer membrane receptor protein involved in Fe transport
MFAILLAALLLQEREAPSDRTPKASDTITVTATRTPTRSSETPASVVVLSRETIAASAAPTLDDTLRQVPGFALFRRSGSRTANPTSQGVSLRGVGVSGASRALVLDDGIPLNDAFGGWVYWGRVPRASIERIEVVRGGASDLYGSSAVGGVIQFVRRTNNADALAIEASGGSQRTGTASLFTSMARRDWRGSLAADLLTTAGYVLVDRGQRGAIDREADSRHAAVDAILERAFGDVSRAFVRLSRYAESRNNGTPLQINDTSIRQVALGIDAALASVRLYLGDQRYHQTFSAIAADRNSERLTTDQRVPSRNNGGSAQMTRAIGQRSVVVAGAEERSVEGTSDEGATSSSGRQRTFAVFAEETWAPLTRLTITGALRYDGWRNFDAKRNDVALANHSDSAWSPRLSAIVRLSDRLALTGLAYRAFRAPTLNELYRNFRVGNVLTRANENLGAERLSAVEVGVRSGPIRATFFSMTTDDTIANVTLATTPALITRQRQNLGSSRSRGLEIESDFRLGRDWRLSAGYLFADARVDTGQRIPQVPRNQATLQLGWRSLVGAQARWSAMQFDDDLNVFPLRGFFVVDVFAAHPIVRNVEVTLAVENIFDRRIETAATPVITLGQPRAVRLGLRYGLRR